MSLVQFKDLFIDLYNSGKSYGHIASLYNTYPTSIRRIISKDVKHRTITESNSVVKSNPFIDLKSSSTNYWLGMLATDGYISSNAFRIGLASIHKEHLEQYCVFIGYNTKITHYLSKNSDKKQYRVVFTQKETHLFLESLGITKRKSLTLNLGIPMTWSFIRGAFDGDGCVYMQRSKSNKYLRVSIATCSELFANQIVNFLLSQNIRAKLNGYNKEGRNRIYIVTVSEQNSIKSFYNSIYSEAKFYLKSKKMKFDGLLVEQSTCKNVSKSVKDASLIPSQASL